MEHAREASSGGQKQCQRGLRNRSQDAWTAASAAATATTTNPGWASATCPREGIRTRQVGRATNRMHVTMSLLERAEPPGRAAAAIPRPGQGTVPLALERNLAGCKPGSASNRPATRACPWVVTTDLVLYFSGPQGTWREAVAVKPWRRLRQRRVNELLNIERVWWTDRGVRWRYVTERELPAALIDNLVWIDEHFDILPGVLQGVGLDEVASNLLARIQAGGATLMAAGAQTDRCLEQQPGERPLLVFRHMLARSRWTVPLFERVRTDCELDARTLTVAQAAPMPLGVE